MSSPHLPLNHFLLALAVVFVWGTNFVVIHRGLEHLPPLLFADLRFLFAFIPALLFFKRPSVSWFNLAAYGTCVGLQFGFLFLAMRGDITPGLASLVVQAQVFMTIGLSMLMTGERMRFYQLPALALAIAGIVWIGVHTDGVTTLHGILLVLCAAACWAGANVFSRRAGRIPMVPYVVWSAPFAVIVMTALTLTFEGWDAAVAGVKEADAVTWAAVLWQSVGNSLFGYAAWAWLLSRHPASTVAPMALLVPVFGMGASALLLAEPMPGWKLTAAAMVMGGLALNLLWPRLVSGLRWGDGREKS